MVTVFAGVPLGLLGRYITFIQDKGFTLLQVLQEPMAVQGQSQLSISKPAQSQMVMVYFPLVEILAPLTLDDVQPTMDEWKKEIEKGA